MAITTLPSVVHQARSVSHPLPSIRCNFPTTEASRHHEAAEAVVYLSPARSHQLQALNASNPSVAMAIATSVASLVNSVTDSISNDSRQTVQDQVAGLIVQALNADVPNKGLLQVRASTSADFMHACNNRATYVFGASGIRHQAAASSRLAGALAGCQALPPPLTKLRFFCYFLFLSAPVRSRCCRRHRQLTSRPQQ